MGKNAISAKSKKSGSDRYAIGIDRGATNIRVGLVRSDGKVIKLAKERRPLLSIQDIADSCEHLIQAIINFMRLPEISRVELDGIAVSMAGVINREGEIVDCAFPPDPSWKPVNLQSILRRQLSTDLNVIVENDSKAAAWGEYVFGAGRGYRDMVCITVGTGIGGGIVLRGELFHGNSGYAGLLGFVSIDRHGVRCPCGMIGCLEDYASGTAIANEARRALHRGEKSALAQYTSGKLDQITCELVFKAARGGDNLARRLIWDAADAIAIAIAGLVHVLNPDVIIIGGGVAEQGDFFLDRIRKTAAENSMSCYTNTPIKTAELGNLAGTIGAAALLWAASGV